MTPRPWWISRLFAACIRGPGSEFLRGDLEEGWHGGVAGAAPRWRAELDHLHAVTSALVQWWSPWAVLRRRRLNLNDREVRDLRTGGGMGVGSVFGAVFRSVRALARHPGFTVVTVATIALGVGATTTILSVVDGVMLRPLPYEESDRLAAVGVTFPEREWVEGARDLQQLAGVSVRNFEYVRERARSFAGLGAAEVASALLPDQGEGPQIVPMARVSDDFFGVLGAGVEAGRLFSPDEYGPNEMPPVVISYGTWVNRFGRDPGVIGTPLPGPAGSTRPTIVGVLSADFVAPENFGLARVEFWQPLDPTNLRYEDRGTRSVSLLGRLAEGVTVDAARAELDALGAEIAREYPDGSVYADGSRFGYGANSLRHELVGTARRPLLVFLGAAALLLLLSAMNTANLLLARATDRMGELSIRRALGAGRRVIVGEVMLESLVLALIGGAVGVAVAVVGVNLFVSLGPTLPRIETVGVDTRVLAASLILSIGTGLAMGLIPSLRAGRQAPSGALRMIGVGPGRAAARVRSALVAAQLGLALMLGVGASVLMHSFVKVASVDPGFRAEGLVSFRLATKRPGGPDETWAAWDETIEAVRGVSGLRAVAGVSNLPFEDPNWAPGIRLPGDGELDVRTGLAGYVITPGYFETMGQDILEGRGVTTADGPGAAPVVVVNRAFVERDFEGRDVVGSTLRMGPDGPEVRVVGIVENVIVRRAEEGPRPAVYVPHTQVDWPTIKVVVRSEREFAALGSDLRQAAATISPIVPIQSLLRLEDRIRSVETEPRFQAMLIGAFALTALLLSAVGLYGALAHTVRRREREFGVRLALGASPARVFRSVLRHAGAVTVAGVTLGLIGSLLLGRALERFLFDVPASDPLGYSVALGALALAVVAAVLAPARRASRVDVVESLRAR